MTTTGPRPTPGVQIQTLRSSTSAQRSGTSTSAQRSGTSTSAQRPSTHPTFAK